MSVTILTPEDAALLGRMIEDGLEAIPDDRQRQVARLVAHRLTSTEGVAILETEVADPARSPR